MAPAGGHALCYGAKYCKVKYPRQLVTTPEVVCTPPGVLGTSLVVVGTTARLLSSATGVLDTRPRVVNTTIGPLGTSPGVLGSVARVVCTSSRASPPPWMTKCSTMKVLVKSLASPMPKLFQS